MCGYFFYFFLGGVSFSGVVDEWVGAGVGEGGP